MLLEPHSTHTGNSTTSVGLTFPSLSLFFFKSQRLLTLQRKCQFSITIQKKAKPHSVSYHTAIRLSRHAAQAADARDGQKNILGRQWRYDAFWGTSVFDHHRCSLASYFVVARAQKDYDRVLFLQQLCRREPELHAASAFCRVPLFCLLRLCHSRCPVRPTMG